VTDDARLALLEKVAEY